MTKAFTVMAGKKLRFWLLVIEDDFQLNSIFLEGFIIYCNINLWVPLCGVPYVFVGHPTSREHVSWLMSDIVLTVFNVALSI